MKRRTVVRLIGVVAIFVSTPLSVRADESWACNPSQYVVVYMNGVLNSKADAEHGRKELSKRIPLLYNGEPVYVRKAYNPTHLGGLGDTITVVIQKFLDQMNSTPGLDFNATEMAQEMHDTVHEGRIVMVPHSQGNFYANSLYEWLARTSGGIATSSMTMENVASPARMTAPGASYILSKSDKVIAGLVGAVGEIAPPNVYYPIKENAVDQLGHNFIDTYLAYGGDRIAGDIETQLNKLAIDGNKTIDAPCIPAPPIGFTHKALSAVFFFVDPLATAIENAIIGTSVVAKGTVAAVSEMLHPELPPEDITSSRSSLPRPDTLATTAIATQATSTLLLPKRLVLNKAIPFISAPGVSENVINAYETRIGLLRQLLNSPPQTPAHQEGGSVINFSPSIPPGPTALTATTTASTATPQTLNESPEWSIEHTFDANSPSVTPENGRLLITEYFVGNANEATWVELMNTSDKQLDLRTTDFIDGESETSFPVTGIPPKSIVVLKSRGDLIHTFSATSSLFRVIEGLRTIPRTNGEFAVRFASKLMDRAPYGGDYCASLHMMHRSCERLVMIAPGNDPSFWTRTRDQFEFRSIDNASSIGAPNFSQEYAVFEGRDLGKLYPNQMSPVPEERKFYSGSFAIATGTIYDTRENELVLSPDDAMFFGDASSSYLTVDGMLTISPSGVFTMTPGADIRTIIHSGGTLRENIGSNDRGHLIIDGGDAFVNGTMQFIELRSGTLHYLFGEDGTAADPPTCATIRSYDHLIWTGGRVYIMGKDCGTFTNGPGDAGSDDLRGLIDPLTHRAVWGTRAETQNEDGSTTTGETGQGDDKTQNPTASDTPPVPPSESLPGTPPSDGSSTTTGPLASSTGDATSTGDLSNETNASSNSTTTTAENTPVGQNSDPPQPILRSPDANGCYSGPWDVDTNAGLWAITCGNGWAPRAIDPPLLPDYIQRLPTEGRLAITEYQFATDGGASWVQLTNMMGSAYVQAHELDLQDDTARIAFPAETLPPRQYIIVYSGNQPPQTPDNENYYGTPLTKLLEAPGLHEGQRTSGLLSFLFSLSTHSEVDTLDPTPYDASVCPGLTTEYGSCRLGKPLLVGNDASDAGYVPFQ